MSVTEFSREQKKEMLMREVELGQEVRDLEKRLEESAQLFDQTAKYLRNILKENREMITEVSSFSLDRLRGQIDINTIHDSIELLRKKRTELEDTTRMLKYVRENR